MRRSSNGFTRPLGSFIPSSPRSSDASIGGTQRDLPAGLLVPSGERRNAENLSEAVGVSSRSMQRFLSEARWDDDAMTGRLQECLGPRLGHSGAVWAGRERLFQAGEEVGWGGPAVLRPAGQGGQLPGRNVPGLCQSLGPSFGGQASVPAGELDLGSGTERQTRRGCRRVWATDPRRSGALEMLERAFLGRRYVLDVPVAFHSQGNREAWRP